MQDSEPPANTSKAVEDLSLSSEVNAKDEKVILMKPEEVASTPEPEAVKEESGDDRINMSKKELAETKQAEEKLKSDIVNTPVRFYLCWLFRPYEIKFDYERYLVDYPKMPFMLFMFQYVLFAPVGKLWKTYYNRKNIKNELKKDKIT